MNKVRLDVLIIVACCTFGSFAQRNTLQTSCPMACASRTCYKGIVCPGSCTAGYCKIYGGREVGYVCIPSCSKSQICVCRRDGTSACRPRCRSGQVCENGFCRQDRPSTCTPRCMSGQVCLHGFYRRDRTSTCIPRCRRGQVCQRGFCRSVTR